MSTPENPAGTPYSEPAVTVNPAVTVSAPVPVDVSPAPEGGVHIGPFVVGGHDAPTGPTGPPPVGPTGDPVPPGLFVSVGDTGIALPHPGDTGIALPHPGVTGDPHAPTPGATPPAPVGVLPAPEVKVPPVVIGTHNAPHDQAGLHGFFARVKDGVHAGRYGVLSHTAKADAKGLPIDVTIRTRDANDELITVPYTSVVRDTAGKR
jgi:hypothetical protein